MFKQDSLWLKWIHNIYIKTKDFWADSFKCDGSCCWKKLVKLQNVLSRDLLENCTSNGRYRTVKCYENHIVPAPKFGLYKHVWCSLALPTHRMNFWLMTQGKLLTRDRLGHWIQLPTLNCPVCELETETHSHLFFDCVFSQTILQRVNNWLGGNFIIPGLSQWLSGLEQINCSRFVNALKLVTAPALVYTVWINRNTCVFSSYSHSINWCFLQIQLVTKSRMSLYRKRIKTDSDREFYNRIIV